MLTDKNTSILVINTSCSVQFILNVCYCKNVLLVCEVYFLFVLGNGLIGSDKFKGNNKKCHAGILGKFFNYIQLLVEKLNIDSMNQPFRV